MYANSEMVVQPRQIRIRGQNVSVPSIKIDGITVIATGSYCKIAQLFDEELIENIDRLSPTDLISAVKRSELRADIFSFARRWEEPQPELDFPYTLDNIAVVSTQDYEKWWTGLPQEARKNVRLAAKRGISVKELPYDDALVDGIKKIYGETPVRQGRRFWHYDKDIDQVREMNATYLERSHFVGAFLDDNLVGFIKYIRVNSIAVLIQILGMEAHRDKRITNALLRHTIEMCSKQGIQALTYGKFEYGINSNSSLTEFKRRNGFEQRDFRQYNVPLTMVGKMLLSANIHTGIVAALPTKVTTLLHRTRSRYYSLLRRLPPSPV